VNDRKDILRGRYHTGKSRNGKRRCRFPSPSSIKNSEREEEKKIHGNSLWPNKVSKEKNQFDSNPEKKRRTKKEIAICLKSIGMGRKNFTRRAHITQWFKGIKA